MSWLVPLVMEARKRTPHTFPSYIVQCLPAVVAELYAPAAPTQAQGATSAALGVPLPIASKEDKLKLQASVLAEYLKIKGYFMLMIQFL